MKKLKVLIPILFLASATSAQTFNKNSWSYSAFLGASNMLGDLGGNAFASTGVTGIADVDFRAFRPAVGVGMSYNMKSISLGANVNATYLIGDDAFSDFESRGVRNLSVRTDLIEATLSAQIRPFGQIPVLKRAYISGGIGGIYYQPKAELNDEWIKLRPLGTEGQLFLADKSVYSTFDLIIPFGVGYKFPLGRMTTLNLDISMRKSFTDYLDDVSTVYANNASIVEAGGAVAGELADRSDLGLSEGNTRGNPDFNDNYFMIGLTFEKTLGKAPNSCYFDESSAIKSSRKRSRRMFNR